ncbi:MAG: hypothetical protein M3O55_12085 [Actinomycetota bacterium]|nr:hypothetical protein [Actinomycetota bacterium]
MDGGSDRWEALFGELEADLAESGAADLRAEVADRTRREQATLRLVDRLRPVIGHQVRVRLVAGGVAKGRLADVGADWLLLADVGAELRAAVLVPLGQVAAIDGLGVRSAMPGSEGRVAAALDLRHALRRLARDRAAVLVGMVDGGSVAGTLDRVGSDFIEVAVHPIGEPRRAAAVRQVLAIPIAAVSMVRSG